jgi:N-acetylneuraminate synthase
VSEVSPVRIGESFVGDGHPCYVVAEIGINHAGDLALAKRLIDVAVAARCDAVKFQKRTVEVVYTPAELAQPRASPFGATNGDLKRGLELGLDAYREIDRYCRERGIDWFASSWDEQSVDFIDAFDVPCHKVASASLTDDDLLRHLRRTGKPILLSTGMSTLAEIDHAIEVLGTRDLVLMHCCSAYPARDDELNLRVMAMLRERYGVPVGYSGHETGLAPTLAAVALGASVVERHVTLDRSSWGSDQAASLEPDDLIRLVVEIRAIELALGSGAKTVQEREVPIMKKLRRKGGSFARP